MLSEESQLVALLATGDFIALPLGFRPNEADQVATAAAADLTHLTGQHIASSTRLAELYNPSLGGQQTSAFPTLLKPFELQVLLAVMW